jgi:hypothetical protein
MCVLGPVRHPDSVGVNTTVRIKRDDVRAAKDIIRVNKSERSLIRHWRESNTINKSPIRCCRRGINVIPSDPEEIKSPWSEVRCSFTNVHNIGVEYAKDTHIIESIVFLL